MAGNDHLTPDAVATLADGLEGWRADGTTLCRDLSAGPLDADALGAELRAAAAERGRELDVRPIADGVRVVLGADAPLTESDVEVVAHLDAVIAGTAPTPGGQDAG